VLTLDVVPFVHAPELPGQRLIVSVNDTVVGSNDIARPTLLGYRIPVNLARRSDRMVVTLQHPDAARPKDFSDHADDRSLALPCPTRSCTGSPIHPYPIRPGCLPG